MKNLFADNFLKSQPTINYGILCAIRQPSIKCLVHIMFIKLSKTTGQSVGIIFFIFFFIFSIFLYQAREIYLKRMLTKGYLVPWNFSWIQNYKLICEKKGGPKFPTALNFFWPKFLSPLQNFVTQGQQVF